MGTTINGDVGQSFRELVPPELLGSDGLSHECAKSPTPTLRGPEEPTFL